MIILITGASHTGKTLLAQRMLEEYKYPYLYRCVTYGKDASGAADARRVQIPVPFNRPLEDGIDSERSNDSHAGGR